MTGQGARQSPVGSLSHERLDRRNLQDALYPGQLCDCMNMREIVAAPSLDVFEAKLDGALSKLG